MRVFSAEEGCAKKKSKRLFILLPKVKTENTLTARITVQLVSSVTALDLTQQESVMLYVQTVITESKKIQNWDQLYSDTSPWVFSGQRWAVPRDLCLYLNHSSLCSNTSCSLNKSLIWCEREVEFGSYVLTLWAVWPDGNINFQSRPLLQWNFGK